MLSSGGDWEVKALTCDQRHYAAVDALVSQQLFVFLDDRRVAGNLGHRPINNPLKEPCRDYNGTGGGGGCNRPNCPFAHVCGSAGCRGKHRAPDCPANLNRDPDDDGDV